MSKVQTLRVFVKQRLTAAAEEIFELFERTIAEYEEELGRQRKLLDAVLKPQVQLHRTDVQQLLEREGEEEEWSSSLDQEEPPELPHIKEEQEKFWTRQEGEQLRGLEEADIIKFTFSPVPDDEEKPQSSQRHQTKTEEMETEADGGPEPDRNSDPDRYLKPVTDDNISHCSEVKTEDDGSEPETDDSSDWEVSEQQDSSCSVCKKTFSNKYQFVKHMRSHTGEKRFRCPVCGKGFARRSHVKQHAVVHTKEKPFSCSVCGKKYTQSSSLSVHFRLHTGENPHACSVCRKSFSSRDRLIAHLRRKHQHDSVAASSQSGQPR